MPTVNEQDNSVVFTAEEYAELYENMSAAYGFTVAVMDAVERVLEDEQTDMRTDLRAELTDHRDKWGGVTQGAAVVADNDAAGGDG